jgi:hypothetical protein
MPIGDFRLIGTKSLRLIAKKEEIVGKKSWRTSIAGYLAGGLLFVKTVAPLPDNFKPWLSVGEAIAIALLARNTKDKQVTGIEKP